MTGDPIEGYSNYQTLGTRGVEVEARFKAERAWLNLNYSFYTAPGKGSVPNYAYPGRSDVLLGTPQHKVVAYGAVGVTEDLWASANAVYLSERYGYVDATVDPAGELIPIAGSVDDGVLLGTFLTLRDVLSPGLDLQVGVQNVLDTRLLLMPAYDGLHPPTPVQSREYLLTLRFDGSTPRSP